MMRRMLFMAVMLAAMIGTAAAAGDVLFGYKFEPGKAQRYRLKLNTQMEMSGMAVSQVADMTVNVTCSSHDKGAYTMNLVFEKVDASNVLAGTTTTDPNAAGMVGKSVIFTVDEHGTVSGITPGPGFDTWSTVQQVVEPTLKSWFVYMPASKVAVGGKWKREGYRDQAASGTEYMTNEFFTFRSNAKEKGRDVALVDHDVTTTVGGTSESPYGTFKLVGTGKGKFEFAYNPSNRTITRLKGDMETKIDMTPQSGGTAMKTTIANHIERELLE